MVSLTVTHASILEIRTPQQSLAHDDLDIALFANNIYANIVFMTPGG